MSDVIRLLPDSVANQIAAGEVIQRPASVIKELVENAVDAGATHIRIIIKDAGRTLIQVIDNGKGMSSTDARMAFERHATSKIKNADDLFNLHTMGFRGEALPSICAVSQIELKTQTEGAPLGTKLLINASKVESQEAFVGETGTNIMVKNLFFNVPARRKFLKSDNVEMSNILREFERLALVNNNIRMSIDYGQKEIDVRPASFKQRITDLWKNSIEGQLLPIEVETSIVKISGFISRPEYAKRRNPLQYLIVNGRNMRHPYFHKAIIGCYENLIAPETQPCYFIKFEVEPSSIDINIHPTKNEIKFEYEQQIWPILQASIRAALGHFGAVPSLDFSNDLIPFKPLGQGEAPKQPKLDLNPNYQPFIERKNNGFDFKTDTKPKIERPNKEWETLYDDFMKSARGFDSNIDKNKNNNSIFIEEIEEQEENICLQQDYQYIVTTSGKNLLIIDQRRAHVKILYEEFMKNLGTGQTISQRLMFPEYIELDNSQMEILKNIKSRLEKIGFSIETLEDNKGKILTTPAHIRKMDYGDLVLSIIESVMDDDVNYGREIDPKGVIDRKISLSLARKAAIPVKGKLTSAEMEHIVASLFALPNPSISPDGKRIYTTIDNEKINSFFSR